MNRILTFFLLIIGGKALGQIKPNEEFRHFIPAGYVLFDKITGDLNKDGLDDYVLIIKGTDKKEFIEDEFRGILDRNLRGIIVLFGKVGGLHLAAKNYKCFSSENEDGGVYFAPELYLEIKEGNLLVSYLHGRYGFWSYAFRFKNSDFELIGYNQYESHGPIVNRELSINFQNKRKIEKVNVNAYTDKEEVKFKITKTKIQLDKAINLSEIIHFDDLELYKY